MANRRGPNYGTNLRYMSVYLTEEELASWRSLPRSVHLRNAMSAQILNTPVPEAPRPPLRSCKVSINLSDEAWEKLQQVPESMRAGWLRVLMAKLRSEVKP